MPKNVTKPSNGLDDVSTADEARKATVGLGYRYGKVVGVASLGYHPLLARLGYPVFGPYFLGEVWLVLRSNPCRPYFLW
jgi:hypothetical protein